MTPDQVALRDTMNGWMVDMSGWTLFLDESGNFDNEGDLGVVGGLLAPGRPVARLQRELRSAIQDALPGMPWPPHSAQYSRAGSRLLAAANLPHRRRPARLAPLVDRHRAWIETVDLRDHDQVADFDLDLRRQHPSDWDQVQAAQGQQDARLAQMVAALALSGADAVAAADWIDPRRLEPPPGDRLLRDAYLRLLVILLERVNALLVHHDRGVELVHAVIADRYVHHRDHPAPLPFHSHFQQEIIDQAARFGVRPDDGPRRDSVRIMPVGGRQPYFRDDCPAGLVLADFIAHRARRQLSHLRRNWPETRKGLAGRLHGLGLERAAAGLPQEHAPLPTVAWGEAARAILLESARHGVAQPVDGLSPPAWVPGATAPWARAAARWCVP